MLNRSNLCVVECLFSLATIFIVGIEYLFRAFRLRIVIDMLGMELSVLFFILFTFVAHTFSFSALCSAQEKLFSCCDFDSDLIPPLARIQRRLSIFSGSRKDSLNACQPSHSPQNYCAIENSDYSVSAVCRLPGR